MFTNPTTVAIENKSLIGPSASCTCVNNQAPLKNTYVHHLKMIHPKHLPENGYHTQFQKKLIKPPTYRHLTKVKAGFSSSENLRI